jgi:YegS/Rv2252/BmrU family lipid kinase
MSSQYKNIHIIINPAAGKDDAILNKLNRVFNKHEVEWHISITKKFGDATKMAQEAISAGADLVAGYGGDGTQMEVANGVLGSDIPMAILPGGTGNAMSFELNIPHKLEEAAELICTSANQRRIDVVKIGDQYFMLRAYTGIEESQKTSRENKDKYGNLAYIADTLKGIKQPPNAQYRLEIDGQVIEEEALTCLILNAGSLGGINLQATNRISVSDGLIDVFMVNKDISTLGALASYFIDAGKSQHNVHHWSAGEVTVEAEPPQTTWIDGELFGPTPFTLSVIPKSVPVVVP